MLHPLTSDCIKTTDEPVWRSLHGIDKIIFRETRSGVWSVVDIDWQKHYVRQTWSWGRLEGIVPVFIVLLKTWCQYADTTLKPKAICNGKEYKEGYAFPVGIKMEWIHSLNWNSKYGLDLWFDLAFAIWERAHFRSKYFLKFSHVEMLSVKM